MDRTRDVLNRRKFFEAEEVRRQQIREEEERPVKEALAENEKLLREKLTLERDAVTKGRPDPAFRIPDSASGLRMKKAEFEPFIKSEADKFVAETPEYYACPENFGTLTQYILAQGVQIPNADVFKVAFARLQELGVLKERPDPEPQVQPVRTEEPDSPTGKRTEWEQYVSEVVVTDPSTGKGYTQYQLDNDIDSGTFARLMRIPRLNSFSPSPRH